MEKLIPFITKHWLLAGAFVLAFIWLIIEEAKQKGSSGNRVSPNQAILLINREHARVVDLRDSNLFSEGHIVGAENIPAADWDKKLQSLEKDKTEQFVLVCNSGQKAQIYAGKLRKLGFKKVVVLTGGMMAWKNANLPLIKSK